jgi:diguanylate cyclase (GGDEF)-like protein/PAS domain S-box-containing protein
MDQLTHPPDGTDHERRLRLILEAAANALVLLDRDGRLLMANARAEETFGYSGAALCSMRLADLLPERLQEPLRQVVESFFDDPACRTPRARTEIWCRRPDGTEVPADLGLTAIVVDGTHLALASVVEVAHRPSPLTRREDDLHGSIVDNIPFSVIATDPAGVVVSANPGATRLLGNSRDDLVGRPLSLVDPTRSEDAGLLAETLAARAGSERERDYRRRDGTIVPVTEAVTRLHHRGGATSGFLAVAYDNTKRRQAQAAVHFMANHDALTNLANRAMLVRHLVGAIDGASDEGTQLALVLLDLDHFKRVNDSMGHHAGDVLLLHVADRLKRFSPRADLVARLGGDEFVVVFTGVADAAGLTADIEDLLQAVTAPISIQGTDLAITLSAGGVVCPRDADNPSALLRLADTAMYHAKAAGRNGFAWFTESMLDDANERSALASDLRLALTADELSVAYQPQVDLATGEVAGFEALVRWNSPTHGPVPPARFIPAAEESGMIVELGSWVLERACHDVAEMQRRLGRRIRIAVNCSPRQFHTTGWVDTVLGSLARSGLEADQLELEITEGVLMDDRWDVLDVLSDLRSHGVSIAIDDFGQGYSSLAYLARFPIDKLKIDRAFVERISAGTTEAPIVDAIIGMAHALGMEVIAEGVETEYQEGYLRAHGCEQVQGFLYSPALAPDDAVAHARATA